MNSLLFSVVLVDGSEFLVGQCDSSGDGPHWAAELAGQIQSTTG